MRIGDGKSLKLLLDITVTVWYTVFESWEALDPMRIELTNKTHYRDDHIREFLKQSIRGGTS
jgi:hypothetical protein